MWRNKGMRVTMNKTKVMISGERQKVRQKAVRWPCGVCSKGVGSNSLQCTCCQKWVHKKCSGIKGSMSKVAKSVICSRCLNPVTSAGRTSVDLGASASSTTATLFITACPSLRSLGSNRSRTLLHMLLSKLPNPVTSLPSSGLYTG